MQVFHYVPFGVVVFMLVGEMTENPNIYQSQ